MKKIVILGANGMLGSEMKKLLPDSLAFSRKEFDITRDINKLYEIKPDVVINCAAYNNVDKAEDDDFVFKVNAEAVRNISEYCKKNNSVFMHFSTNYVFNGKKEMYCPEDKPDPLNRYGLSKAMGEKYVKELERFFLIRTALVFGGTRKNIVRTLFSMLKENKPLKLVDNITNITYAKDLAKASIELLKKKDYGIHHITNSGILSIYELGKYIKEKINSKSALEKIKSENRKAKRPLKSALKNTVKTRHWKEAVDEYIKFMMLGVEK